MSDERIPKLEPAIFVIFGITGDLSRRKLLPALYYLIKSGLLHEHTEVVGVSRREVSVEDLLHGSDWDTMTDPATLAKMSQMITMQHMDLTSAADYEKLRQYLDDIETKHGVCMNRLFYLSIPPQVYGPIVRLLGQEGLQNGCQHGTAMSRLLIEKPFGYDVRSAEALITETGQIFNEAQIFRIDHYVAKETVQNLLVFRFNNPLFEAIWNNRHIHHIEITATEQIDIEGRATFYEETGALRDFVQSHLMQLLALLTMDEPEELTSTAIHAAKLNLLKQVQPIGMDEVREQTVRGQYEGYKDEVQQPNSHRETYAALKLFIDTPRWQGVPILIRTGKALNKKETKLAVVFDTARTNTPNCLYFRIQPDEGIALQLLAKKPGYDEVMQSVTMNFSYEQTFDDHGHPDAYEHVLVDAVRGDHTLFSTGDEVMASWRALETIVQAWERDDVGLLPYPKGSAGPAAAETLAESAQAVWL